MPGLMTAIIPSDPPWLCGVGGIRNVNLSISHGDLEDLFLPKEKVCVAENPIILLLPLLPPFISQLSQPVLFNDISPVVHLISGNSPRNHQIHQGLLGTGFFEDFYHFRDWKVRFFIFIPGFTEDLRGVVQNLAVHLVQHLHLPMKLTYKKSCM